MNRSLQHHGEMCAKRKKPNYSSRLVSHSPTRKRRLRRLKKCKATGKLKRPKTYSTNDAINEPRKANKATKPAKATKSTKSKTEAHDPAPEQADDEDLVDEDDPEREWLGEIISKTKTHYLMKWLDKDPVTDKYLHGRH